MKMKTKSTSLLTLALVLTAAITFAPGIARATLVTSSIQGCLLVNVPAAATAEQIQTACATNGGAGGNQFGPLTPTVDGAGLAEFGVTTAKWDFSATFDTAGNTTLTITNLAKNNKTGAYIDQNAISNTRLYISNLTFTGGEVFDGFDNVTLDVTEPMNAGNISESNLNTLLTLPIAKNDTGYFIALNNAAVFGANETVTLTATLRTVPEPGSLALLGAVLLALGLVSVKRVRISGVRTTHDLAS